MTAALGRRATLARAGATAALLVCEAVVPAVARAVVPLQACGCTRVHELKYGHTCTVHDETGRRWDSYSAEEVAAMDRETVEPAKAEWACECGRHDNDPDQFMAIGTPCIWRKTSYEYDEWEVACIESHRDGWLLCVTTDWVEFAKESGCA